LSAFTLSVRAVRNGTSMERATLSSFGKADSKEQKALLALSDAGTSAVFGDVATLTTRLDPKIRK
jgi:hypothetical protein